MSNFAPADVLALALRLAFVVLLYTVVFSVLLALRSDLKQAARRAPREGSARVPPRLTLLEAAEADGPPGRSLRLVSALVIGRRSQCDVVLRDDAVSGRHARLSGTRDGWRLEDLGSTNGTFVNGQRLAAPVMLQPGDVITIGASSWRFEEE